MAELNISLLANLPGFIQYSNYLTLSKVIADYYALLTINRLVFLNKNLSFFSATLLGKIIKNILPKSLIRATLLGLLSLSGQANASTSTFTDSASFFAALPDPSSTQDFEDLRKEIKF